MRKFLFCLAVSAALSGTLCPAFTAVPGHDDKVLVSKAVPQSDASPVFSLTENHASAKTRKRQQPLFQGGQTAEKRNPLEVWQEKPLSMFVNFGLYSSAAGNWKGQEQKTFGGEMLGAHVFMDEYEELAAEFRPSDFDAARIVNLAKKSGMESIVFTAKHHDGFCMFKTASTSFNSVSAPLCGRDFVAELSNLCLMNGLGFGVYYSLNDWHYPQASGASSHNACPVTPEHLRYIKEQLSELLSHYTLFTEIWFDGGSLTPGQSEEIYAHVKSLQPDCLVGGLGNDCCDFVTLQEDDFPRLVPDTPWKLASRMYEGTWGYRNWEVRGQVTDLVDAHFKTMTDVLAAGGNYMIDVALNEFGGVILSEAQVLNRMGDILRRWKSAAAPVPAKKTAVREKQVLKQESLFNERLAASRPVTKGMQLKGENACIRWGLSGSDEYLSARTVLSYNWMLSDFGLRKVEFEFAAEDIGTFVILEIDGRSYHVELLPDSSSPAQGRLEFGNLQTAKLPLRHNPEPDSLYRYVQDKKPYFINMKAGLSENGVTEMMRPMSSLLLHRTVFSSAAAQVPVKLVSGDAMEVVLNGRTIARHLNPYGAQDYEEIILMDMAQGQNEILLKSYSRNGGPMRAAVLPSGDTDIYRMTFVIPDYIPGFKHIVRLSRKDPYMKYADACLHNLRIVFR